LVQSERLSAERLLAMLDGEEKAGAVRDLIRAMAGAQATASSKSKKADESNDSGDPAND
jgi:hypothetical protein